MNVSVIGVGQTPVGEHWELSLRHLSLQAIRAAMENAGIESVDAIVVGNALGGLMSNQNHLGALVADFAGLRGIEGFRVEAADASGGLASRQGAIMVAAGQAKTLVVLGIGKSNDLVGRGR